MIEWCKAHSKPEAKITEYEQQLSLQRQKLAMILQLEHNPPDATSIREKISEIDEVLGQIIEKIGKIIKNSSKKHQENANALS